MKVEVRHLLIASTVGDQTVTGFFESKFLDQSRDDGKEIDHKVGVTWLQAAQGRKFATRHQQDMQSVGRVGMVKGKKGSCFHETRGGQSSAHISKDPAHENTANPGAG